LKHVGKELLGHCPLHDDHHPSMRINPDKGVWYCPVCSVGGDVFTFLEKVEGLGFKDAISRLGIEEPSQRPRKTQVAKDEAKQIVTWAAGLSNLIGEKLREIGQDQRLLQWFTEKGLATWQRGVLQRQWTILIVIDNDLADPVCMIELYEHRDIVEGLLSL